MTDDDPTALIPARIVNEHSYCPRLAYLMWVDGANADNTATVEGAHVHRKVDRPQAGRSTTVPKPYAPSP